MLRCNVTLADVQRLEPASFVNREGRAVAWLDVHGDGTLGLWGTPDEMREFAAAVSAAADEAGEMQTIADRLAAVGVPRVDQFR